MDTSIAKRVCKNEAGNLYELEYRLVIDPLICDDRVYEDYGVCICGSGLDTVRIPSITVNRERIDELMQLLVRNCVFPASLPDILEDWL